MQLTIELQPLTLSTPFFYTEVYEQQWDFLQRSIYQRAGGKCECCGSTEELRSHISWDFNFQTSVAKISKMSIYCSVCYLAKNLDGFSLKTTDDIVALMRATNGFDYHQTEKYLAEQKTLFDAMNRVIWVQDYRHQIDWLNKNVPPPAEYLIIEEQISELKQQIASFLNPDQDDLLKDRCLLSIYASYPKEGYRSYNIYTQKEFLSKTLAFLNAHHDDKQGGMSTKELIHAVVLSI